MFTYIIYVYVYTCTFVYEGLSTEHEERARIGAAMSRELAPGAGLPTTLMMAHHGGVTVGRTVEEAWVRMHYLDVVCRVHLLARGGPGAEVPEIPAPMLRHARAQFDGSFPDGKAEWPALLRRALAGDRRVREPPDRRAK